MEREGGWVKHEISLKHVIQLVSCAVLLMLAKTSFAQVLESIVFQGNDVTHESVLLQEMGLFKGDKLDAASIEASRQAVMDLGLFKSVNLVVSQGTYGQVLTVTVKEKYYLFPIPRFRRSADGDISYGAQLRMDNVAGLNHKLRLTYKTAKNCCELAGREDSIDLSYLVPRILGTHFGLNFGTRYAVAPIDAEFDGLVLGRYEKVMRGLNVSLRRWLSHRGATAGWSVSAGWFWRVHGYELLSGEPGFYETARSVGLSGRISYERIHDYLYSREGTEYGYLLTLGLNFLGADHSYSANSFYYRRYWRVGTRPHQNLNIQLETAFSGNRPVLSDDAFAIGGSDSLRGYEKNSLAGASYFNVNIEYLSPIFRSRAFRGVLFVDVGNAYEDNRMIDLSDLETGGGVGFRYRVKSLVNMHLRVDVAYSSKDSERKVYIGTKSTF